MSPRRSAPPSLTIDQLPPIDFVLISHIHSKYSLGIHWGTFPLTAEPIDEPPRRLRVAAKSLKGSVFVTYPLGKTKIIPFP